MKPTVLIAALACAASWLPAQWHTDLHAARRAAADGGKPLLAVFR